MNRCVRSLPLITLSLVGLGFIAASARAGEDCFQVGGCLSFVGAVPGQCMEDPDDKIPVDENTGDVVVLPADGSSAALDIDLVSSVSEGDDWYNWHRYDLSDQGSATRADLMCG
ncbi:MAG: hypothetical protein AAF243_15330 [Cyanobacteria bacterium P01_A01_bin.137]